MCLGSVNQSNFICETLLKCGAMRFIKTEQTTQKKPKKNLIKTYKGSLKTAITIKQSNSGDCNLLLTFTK